jgi:hypothetical protein
LDEPNADEIRTYQVDIEVSVVFKTLALLQPSGWDYYMWLDSFLDALEQAFSKSAFFKRIDWDGVMAVARVMRQAPALGSRKETDSVKEVPEVTAEDSVLKVERTT